VTKDEEAEGPLPVYQVALPLSTKTILLVKQAIAEYRRDVGSRWRKLPDGAAAILVLAHLRHDQRLRDLAAANGISPQTLSRWTYQVLARLAARAPRLDRVLAKAARTGLQVILLDGVLVRTRRRTGKQNRRNYNGKHKCHGLMFLGITDTAGNLLWISQAYPGRSSDLTIARYTQITAKLAAAGLAGVGDLGFSALDKGEDPDAPTIFTGRRAHPKRPLTAAEKQTNAILSAERAANEHAFADLKNWRILAKLRIPAHRATTLLRGLQVLTASHVTR